MNSFVDEGASEQTSLDMQSSDLYVENHMSEFDYFFRYMQEQGYSNDDSIVVVAADRYDEFYGTHSSDRSQWQDTPSLQPAFLMREMESEPTDQLRRTHSSEADQWQRTPALQPALPMRELEPELADQPRTSTIPATVHPEHRTLLVTLSWPLIAFKSYTDQKRIIKPYPKCTIRSSDGNTSDFCVSLLLSAQYQGDAVVPDAGRVPMARGETYWTELSTRSLASLDIRLTLTSQLRPAWQEVLLPRLSMKILSKPGVKHSGFIPGATVGLFNHTNAQASSVKYWSQEEGRFCLRSAGWTPFRVHRAYSSRPEYEPIHYGDLVMFEEVDGAFLTGFYSVGDFNDSAIRIDRNVKVEQGAKVTLELYEPVSRSERSSMLQHTGLYLTANSDDAAEFPAHASWRTEVDAHDRASPRQRKNYASQLQWAMIAVHMDHWDVKCP